MQVQLIFVLCLVFTVHSETECEMAAPAGRQLATVAGGCFWCIEAVYNMHKGVHSAVSGYMGGKKDKPTYEEVCKGTTGHAEVVQVTFDPQVVSYAELLEVFWKVHDPTTLNRQGNDVGTQYRSAIYYHDDEQKRIAEASKAAATEAQLYSGTIVTEITKASKFFPAEAYHQEYYKNNPNQGYCHAVVGPKVKKFKELFREKLK
ncbi:Peptide methionine sulfoxide reductase MsrA [Orchesella cincta]|uniref:peptide-methionine (S)-S-oxide reductase n=1 Tax=Orchesella cincta TaxID=48709 RepID=A0A1D2N2S3_ORCCI|nr:Peptide methionine sulfoxide reductase MsrA [Orchesella cincta]